MALIYCSHCGKQVSDKAAACPHCHANLHTAQPAPQTSYQQSVSTTQQSVFVNVPTKSSNGIGTAGLVFALLGFFFCWVPVLGWVIWFLGLLFSFIGLFKSPRGCAIAGFIISIIDLIILVALVGVLAAAFS